MPFAKHKKANSKKTLDIFQQWVSKEFDYKIHKHTADIVEKSAKKHLKKTLKYSTNSATSAFKNAEVYVETNLKKEGNAPRTVEYKIVVVEKNSSNKPHKIWHIINFGRPANKYKYKKRVTFPVRKKARTRSGKLDSMSFEGYTGEFRSFGAGMYMPKIKARSWYNRWVNSYLKKHHKTKFFETHFEIVTKGKKYKIKKGG